jgi:hypothetical protein
MATSSTRSVTDYIQLGWEDFTKNPLILLALVIVPFLLHMAVSIPANFLNVYMKTQNETNLGLTLIGIGISLLLGLFQVVFHFFWTVVQSQTTYRLAKGQKVEFGDMLSVTPYLIPALGASLINMLAISVGMVMLIIPGLIVLLMVSFTNFFIVSRNMGAIEAIQASFQTVMQNAGTVILTFLLMSALNLAGLMLCCVGILISGPVTLMMFARLFVDLTETSSVEALVEVI